MSLNYYVMPGIVKMDKQEYIDNIFKNLIKQGYTLEDIIGPSRKRGNVNARFVAIYFIRNKTNFGWVKIAKIFGNKDHTTIISAYRRCEDLISINDSQIIDIINKLK